MKLIRNRSATHVVVLAGALLTMEVRARHADGGAQVSAVEEVVVGRAGQAALLCIAVVCPAAQFRTGCTISGARRPR